MITNLQNQKKKSIVRLQQKSSERKSNKKFVIEGKREISIAQNSGFDIFEIYLCQDIFTEDPSYPINIVSNKVIPVSSDVYNKLAYRKNVEGIIALASIKETGLSYITLSSNPLLLILETLEKPGNLGAILRTADAAGVDAVIVCDLKTDLYNPNVIRSSLGCVFSNQVVVCGAKDVINWLNKNQFSIYAATPEADNSYYAADYNKPTALVFGAESEGLTKQWEKALIQNISIPMKGKIDSLNVSVSVGVILYEVIRQRNAITNH